MYTFNVIHTYDELLSLKQQWDNLLDHAVFDTFFCCHDWICCWWLSFAQPDDIMTVVMVEKDGKLAAIAPLMIRSHKEYGFSPKVLRFIGVPNADRCDIIIGKGNEEVISELASFLMEKVQGWDQLHLNEVPEESLFAGWLKENKSLVYVEAGSECPYVPLANWESWDEYFNNLSKSTRKKVNHNFNRLKKSGYIEVNHLLMTDRDEAIFRQAKELEQTSEKAQRISNLGLADEQSNFFQKKLQEKQRKHQIMLSVLEKDGELIAYNYGYLYKNIYYFYNTAYADKEDCNSPGMLILKETLCHLMKNGIDELDCLRGATVSKKRWAKCSRIQQNIYYLKSSPVNWLYVLAVFKIRPFLKKNIMPLLHKQ